MTDTPIRGPTTEKNEVREQNMGPTVGPADTHPGFHVCEEILELGESDLGGAHELLHDGEVPVPGGESLPTVELHLPAAFLHASSQLSHVLLQFFHAEIGNSRHVHSIDTVWFIF